MKSFFQQQRIWNLIRLFFARNFVAILFLLEQTNLTEKQIFSGSNFNFLTRHIFSQVVGGSGSLLKQRDFFRAPTPLHSRPWETGKQRVRRHLKNKVSRCQTKCRTSGNTNPTSTYFDALAGNKTSSSKIPPTVQALEEKKRTRAIALRLFLSDSSNGNFLAPIIFQARNFLKSA